MDAIFRNLSQEEFEKAIQQVIHNYCDRTNSPITTDAYSLQAAKEDLQQLLIDCHYDTNKVSEILNCKGWSAEKIAFFVKLLNDKKTELLYATLIIQNSAYGETITDFDWKFKLVLGTSELNSLRYPLLQLVLFTENNAIQNKCSYDIGKDMLLKLLNTLEALD